MGAVQEYSAGVLAHSTHLRGSVRGNGMEKPNYELPWRANICEDCARLTLVIWSLRCQAEEWKTRWEGVFTAKAGEILYV